MGPTPGASLLVARNLLIPTHGPSHSASVTGEFSRYSFTQLVLLSEPLHGAAGLHFEVNYFLTEGNSV